MTGKLWLFPDPGDGKGAAPRSELARVVVNVHGVPAPKGSMKAFVVGRVAPRAVVTHDNNERTKMWAGLVGEAARAAMVGRVMFRDQAVQVHVEFRLPRPAGHYKPSGEIRRSAPRFPLVKPDLDKLVRATMDAIKGVVFDEDSRIVSIAAGKYYATADVGPGALITVTEQLV